MTPAEHRKSALDLLATADALRPASPGRADLVATATLHALLALSAPEPEPAPELVEAPVVVEAPVAARKSRAKTPKPPTPAAG